MRIIAIALATISIPVMLLAEPKGTIDGRPKTQNSETGWLKADFVERSLIVVPVFINESGPYRFLLDTGAGISMLSAKIAAKLKLDGGRPGSMFTAAGALRVDIRRLKAFTVGEARIDG